MKPNVTVLWVAVTVIVASSTLQALEKSRYDVKEPGPGDSKRAPTLSSYGLPGWEIAGSIGETALLPGGYFTFGTVNGLSTTKLDSRCGITFGHPFAKTSYPLLCVDGAWARPDHVFDLSDGTATLSGDSLLLMYQQAGLLRLMIAIRLGEDGKSLQITSHLTNLDTLNHTLGLGFVVDPALGKWGDGHLSIGQKSFVRDTSLPLQVLSGQSVAIFERSTTPRGMGVSLEFPDGTPGQLIAANWVDVAEVDAPLFTPSSLRLLYDLVLKASWDPVVVAPGGEMRKSLLIRQLIPDFGNTVFLRWDLVDHLVLDEGLLFPSTFTSTATLSNAGTSSRPQGSLGTSGGEGIIESSGDISATLASTATLYAPLPVTVSELCEPKILPFTLLYREGTIVVDSLVRLVYLPATPVSDTGLIVTIDSVILSHPPTIQALFEVERKATGAKLLNLLPRNIFLYDNGLRIEDFLLGHDTTGRVNTDIVFVLDVTGSMGGEIDQVKSNIEEFADSLTSQGLSFRLALITFLDVIENVYEFTSDVSVFKSRVAAQSAHAGEDAPENSLDALSRASQLDFLPGAQRLVIWITDSNYHERDDFTTRTKQEVIARLLQTDITVFSIGDPTYQTDWYNPIVNATGGEFYSILGNFRDILLDIGRHQLSPRYSLWYQPSSAAPHALSLWVHYAGLGGFASTTVASGSLARRAALECYPNPFNPSTTIRIELPEHASASLVVYNLLGQEVRRFEEIGRSGMARVTWDARDERGRSVATGVYIVRCDIRTGTGERLSREYSKIIYLK